MCKKCSEFKWEFLNVSKEDDSNLPPDSFDELINSIRERRKKTEALENNKIASNKQPFESAFKPKDKSYIEYKYTVVYEIPLESNSYASVNNAYTALLNNHPSLTLDNATIDILPDWDSSDGSGNVTKFILRVTAPKKMSTMVRSSITS